MASAAPSMRPTRASMRDLGLAGGVIAIIAMLIVPMPGWLLDFGLALSITFSVMILMTALFIEKPLHFSAFPTVLLVVTLLRLGLNLASTRLILTDGHEGVHAAGGIIAAFGTFLMGGDVIIGLTIFAILVIINFIVITKGAGRIAEVAARFSLDAMPGKQMAIDADLSSGLITEAQARERRSELEAESGFFGAMDGASKFVRGDAVAGLLITAVNIIVGLIIGVAVHGLDIGTAFHTYTILTVGDGLVSQIPALIVSVAAGMLVSKGGVTGRAEAAIAQQLSRDPKAIGMAGALLIGLALMPGLPFLPFAVLGGGTMALAWTLTKSRAQTAANEAAEAAKPPAPTEEPITAALAVDPIRIELGYALLPLVNDAGAEHRLEEQVRALRRQLATDLGFVLPATRILDNLALRPEEYVIYLKEVEVGRGELRVDRLLALQGADGPTDIPGEETREPAFGLPALWIDPALREEAGFRGLTVVDAPTVIATHLVEIIKDNIADLLSYADTQALLAELPKDLQKLVGDLVPQRIAVSGIQRVLQRLLTEGVSIRDLPTILEGIAEGLGFTQSPIHLAEHVRSRLARQISSACARDGTIPIVTLSPDWEDRFAENLVGTGDDRQLVMPPSQLQAFIAALRDAFDRFAQAGETPCLLTSPLVRPYVRMIMERVRPTTTVLSQNEIHLRARVRALGTI
ncbi:MAG: flagellar biosynthesis protein FlhA [Alphaproteobacteria bacterium]|nr:flagellar biosynthesis protein FlhA [Alphaproteobacteria bacterium]